MVDRRGNRRFHGAFTGGFSAGYYNTVGSETGYQAQFQHFTSSRDARQSVKKQTALDFMDAEDMATSKNLLQTQNQFNSLQDSSYNTKKQQIDSLFGTQMGKCYCFFFVCVCVCFFQPCFMFCFVFLSRKFAITKENRFFFCKEQ